MLTTLCCLKKALNTERVAGGLGTCEDGLGFWVAKGLPVYTCTVWPQKAHPSVPQGGRHSRTGRCQSRLHARSSPLRVLQSLPLQLICGRFLHACAQQIMAKGRQMVSVAGERRGVNPALSAASVQESMAHNWIHFPLGVLCERKLRVMQDNGRVRRHPSQGHLQK